MQLIIDSSKNLVSLSDFPDIGYQLGTIENALGNVLSMLETEFPKAAGADPAFWVSDFMEDAKSGFSADRKKKIWGFSERGSSLWDARQFLSEHAYSFTSPGVYYPDLREVEELRVQHHIELVPVSSIDRSMLSFNRISKTFHVIYGLLYYYAFFGFGLKRCRVCGRLYAVRKKEAQSRYCNRKCSYTDIHGKITEYDSCQVAQEAILDRCRKREKRITDHLYSVYGSANDIYIQFRDGKKVYKDRIRKNPFLQNLHDYEYFLFVDSDSLCPRYKH